MKLIWLIILSLALVSCAPADASEPEWKVEDFMARTADGAWGLLGGAELTNYRVGKEIDKDTPGYEPYYILNRVNEVTEVKQITTDPGETLAAIPIHRKLYKGDTVNVKITSDQPETLVVIGYDDRQGLLKIDGFLPGTSRIVEITYRPYTTFSVFVEQRGKGLDDYVEALDPTWVKIEISEITLGPESYGEINWSLFVPKGVEPPEKWLLWLTVVVAEPINVGTIKTAVLSGEQSVITGVEASSSVGVSSEIAYSMSLKVAMR